MSTFLPKTLVRFALLNFEKDLSHMILPNFERDLSRAVTKSLESSAKLTDCFLPPTVYGYEKQQVVWYKHSNNNFGIGRATSALEKRIATATEPPPTFEKIRYPVPGKGLFR